MGNKTRAIPEGFHSVTPSLTLKNSLRAIEFYKQAFGAEVLDLLPAPDGKSTMHATIKIGDSIVMMGDEMPGCAKSAESLGGSPISLYVYVLDVDETFRQAVSAGASQTMPVTDMFWGDRCAAVNDPFGYSWMIGTHVRDLTQEEVEAGARGFCEQMAAQSGQEQFSPAGH